MTARKPGANSHASEHQRARALKGWATRRENIIRGMKASGNMARPTRVVKASGRGMSPPPDWVPDDLVDEFLDFAADFGPSYAARRVKALASGSSLD